MTSFHWAAAASVVRITAAGRSHTKREHARVKTRAHDFIILSAVRRSNKACAKRELLAKTTRAT